VSIAPHEQLTAAASLLSAWSRRRQAVARRPQDRLSAVLGSLSEANSDGIRSALRRAVDFRVEVVLSAGYVFGPAIASGTPVMWPVAAVTASPDLSFAIRVALFFECEGNVWAEGWRFETADSPGRPHPYLHAQHARGFGGASDQNFLSPMKAVEQSAPVNESEPAFPLRGTTCVGLVATMLATLYGAVEALEIAGDAGNDLRGALLEEVRSILTGS